jgi:hypothetical protein
VIFRVQAGRSKPVHPSRCATPSRAGVAPVPRYAAGCDGEGTAPLLFKQHDFREEKERLWDEKVIEQLHRFRLALYGRRKEPFRIYCQPPSEAVNFIFEFVTDCLWPGEKQK